jgi:hypothetical protein
MKDTQEPTYNPPKYCIDHLDDTQKDMYNAIENNRLADLIELFENKTNSYSYFDWNTTYQGPFLNVHFEMAARKGYFNILQYIIETSIKYYQGCNWDKYTCYGAAAYGHFKCLRLAHQKGCPIDEKTCANAALYGHIKCLMYLHKNGCPWDELTCGNAISYRHLECLKYARKNGCPWDDMTCTAITMTDNIEFLKYAYEISFPWNEETCSNVAMYGYIDTLKYLREHGCPWNESTPDHAACYGHIECLKYAHQNGCPLDKLTTCSMAVRGGYIECLKYAHKNGCIWDDYEMFKDYQLNTIPHIECIKYVYENGWNYPIQLKSIVNQIIKQIVKKILIPKWRDSVKKSRPIVIYWMELGAKASCAEKRRARIEDKNSFENDCNSLI